MNNSNRHAGFTLIEILVVLAIIGILIALLLPSVQSIREAARRTQCLNNMRQLGIGVTSYEGTRGAFPPSYQNGHCWAAILLPYIEQKNIADVYDFGIPWNHANNQVATTSVVTTYVCPSNPNATNQRFDEIGGGKRAATGDYAAISSVSKAIYSLGYARPVDNRRAALTHGNRPTEIRDIVDGLSNTIMFIEDVGRPVHYTSKGRGPDNHDPGGGNFDVTNGRVRGAGWADSCSSIPVHGFSADGMTCPGPVPVNATNNNEAFGFHPQVIVTMVCDGSVRVLDENITMQQYTELITREGREVNSYKF